MCHSELMQSPGSKLQTSPQRCLLCLAGTQSQRTQMLARH